MTDILVVDNYDSFTYNLVQYLAELGATVEVVRNDQLDADEVASQGMDGVLLSPGPGVPDGAGVCLPLVSTLAGRVPLFGVCLGHQCIGQAFGARVVAADRLMHGRTSEIAHGATGVFSGLPSPFVATRYHSLILERSTLPVVFEVTAETKEGELMGIRHKTLGVEGVQFHPESFLTEHGHTLLGSWLRQVAGHGTAPDGPAASGPAGTAGPAETP